jgi:hypothetical protein
VANITYNNNSAIITPTGSEDIHEVEITREQARQLVDEFPDMLDDLMTAIDVAQAETDDGTSAIVLLVIKPDAVPSAA